MEKQITINIPEGKEIKQELDKDGNITIKVVDKVITRSKSWEEFCENHRNTGGEWYISPTNTVLQHVDGLQRKDCTYHLETKEDAEGILALIQLTRLHDEWVGDWKPTYKAYHFNWFILHGHDDDNTDRFAIEWTDNINYLLSFPTKDMTNEFLECFYELIVKAKKFI